LLNVVNRTCLSDKPILFSQRGQKIDAVNLSLLKSQSSGLSIN
jgi:hypothetical protein